jgi:hypothetical protein
MYSYLIEFSVKDGYEEEFNGKNYSQRLHHRSGYEPGYYQARAARSH